MQSKSLHATLLLSTSLGCLLYTDCVAQAPTRSASATALPASDNDPNDDFGGLPTFLLKVPGGDVLMGMPVDEFIAACSQAAFPIKPKMAWRVAGRKFADAMRRSSSMIGRKPVAVDTFFLGKWPVKNSEYATFVDQRRAAKIDVRPPLHWWRDGCPEDYQEHLPKIRKEFPKNSKGLLYYWERHGHKLPYKLLDEKGRSIADHPVVYTSWRDANKFAANIGMRLPTEAELTRAMRGDGARTWPGNPQDPDAYTEEMKKLLGMDKARDLRTKPVGTIASAVGPFGHLDMFGQVWQWVGGLGFTPINGMDIFLKNWKALQKHKQGRMCDRKPTFVGGKAIAKGGSFLSYQEPVQLMLDARAPIETNEVLEALGFRLAKSIAPGYDYMYSLQRVEFDTSAFAKDQELTFDRLVGAERYTLAPNGFPSAYDAVVFAPVNWLVDVKGARLNMLLDGTQKKPILIGALATTAKFDNGAKSGLYSVFYRKMGIPRELRDAVKIGHKELVKARKEAEKKAKREAKAGIKKKDSKQKDSKQKAVRKWRITIKKFGLTDEDIIAPKGVNGDIGYVTIDGLKIPTDRDAFILSTRGKMVSVLPGTKKKPSKVNPFANDLTIEAGEEGKLLAKLRFGIPMMRSNLKNLTKVVAFDLHALLDQPAPTEDKPWRLPQEKSKQKKPK